MSNIEKIKAYIERQRGFIEGLFIEGDNNFYDGQDDAYNHLLAFIDSLPDEKATCKTCGFYENNCPFIRGKLIPYPNKVCKDYTYSAMKEQEKPSEDLEEAAEKYADKHGFRVPYDGSNNYYDDVDVKASKDGFIAGAEWQKEQMMKEAVEGRVHLMGFHNAIYSKEPDWTDYLDGFNEGDKVKIIIVKQ